MSDKILFVDDEPNVLNSIRRGLRSRFNIDTAEGGEQALRKMAANGSYAVIVSDMRMPGMTGVELLAEAKKKYPDTVRMMLTGNADQQTAVDAVNHGDIFRFLNKPCNTDNLAVAVENGLRQHRLITAEKDVLENTLQGSIKALSDVLALTNPEVFGRATRFRNRITNIAAAMGLDDVWQLESVAMLSQVGCVTVSEDLVKRRMAGHPLAEEELEAYAAHAAVGAELLKAIPRMETVARSIRYQEKNFDGSGYPKDDVKGEDIPLGARLLKPVVDFEAFERSGDSATEALQRLKQKVHHYDPAVLEALESLLTRDSSLIVKTIGVSSLSDSMVLAEDVRTSNDVLLVGKGQEMTISVRRHLQNFLAKELIDNSVKVWCRDG